MPTSGLRLPMPYPGDEAVHPSIVHVPSGFGGYEYWLAYTPYTATDPRLENPCIAASHDGTHWVVPTGATNPLCAPPPGTAHNSDPCLSLVDGVLHLFWRESDDASGTSDLVHLRTSPNGTDWSPAVLAHANPGHDWTAPAILADDEGWVMWAVRANTAPDAAASGRALLRRRAPTPTGPWGPVETCTLELPAGQVVWHQSIRRFEGWYVGLFNIQTPGTSRTSDLVIATSSDGLDWGTSSGPLIRRSAPHHDRLYHGDFVVHRRGGALHADVWYSAFRAGHPNTWSISRTRLRRRVWSPVPRSVRTFTGSAGGHLLEVLKKVRRVLVR
ncbi:hypothetical protein CLV37_101686 [Kineococcus rhizosphaerae]|uniref:Glycosyl hydrolase family 43 n=1 Tax=Kineococcus rhizosphaerae TaxID=559628 RepID=A0A2T0RBD2_9ACTN|nr:hypothetical protein CLV37_101686 [Kineococcus rhizosphaerae]